MIESSFDSVLGEHWLRPPIIHLPPFYGRRLGVEAEKVLPRDKACFCDPYWTHGLEYGLSNSTRLKKSLHSRSHWSFLMPKSNCIPRPSEYFLMKTLIHSTKYDDALAESFGERADLDPVYAEIIDKFVAYSTTSTSSTSILSLASEKLLVHSGSCQGHSRLFMISFTENEFSLTLQNFYSFSLSALKAS